MEMRSIYIRQLVWPVTAPLEMHMRGYIGGVATLRVLPYPAISLKFPPLCQSVYIIDPHILHLVSLSHSSPFSQ